MPFTPLIATPSLTLTERIVTISTSLLVEDANNLLTVNSASGVTITIPTHASAPIPIGSQILVYRFGSGGVTLAMAGGVTLHAISLTLRAQFSFVTLVKLSENLWAAGGDLT